MGVASPVPAAQRQVLDDGFARQGRFGNQFTRLIKVAIGFVRLADHGPSTPSIVQRCRKTWFQRQSGSKVDDGFLRFALGGPCGASIIVGDGVPRH